ncbi:glycerate kinase [Mycolicibacterium conceptionense]|uniref:Glycerate kinase n=1 Tax=Mycolicibacterium conceptionense TaxID=451644 RepID=A0A0U1DY84_9MYCO|nr:glycerate kinase [Mycolicibacterium conceptionense]
MKIVLAPDSFKESMTASQAVAAMREGVWSVLPHAECVGVPMADGGEGTVDAVVDALGGERITVEVSDPLGRPARATYGYVAARSLAVIEMASASGLELVAPSDRDILRASTFGVGQLIVSALDRGATELLIGIGGSATNDGGAGMLTALGVAFSDADGAPLPPGGPRLPGCTASTPRAWTADWPACTSRSPPTSPHHCSEPAAPARFSALRRGPLPTMSRCSKPR